VPWRALVERCAAWITIVSGETSGFVKILVFKENRVAYSCGSCFCYVHFETAMMFHGCSYVETSLQMGIPGALCIRFYMGLHCATQWCKRLPHVVMLAMDVGIG
jgi:hypothetical protein